MILLLSAAAEHSPLRAGEWPIICSDNRTPPLPKGVEEDQAKEGRKEIVKNGCRKDKRRYWWLLSACL